MSALLIDIAEFVANPIRTGIQRVIRELLTRWPGDTPRSVVRFDPGSGGLVRVPDALLEFLVEAARQPHLDESELKRRGRQYLESTPAEAITLGRQDRILVPELFACRERAAFYTRLRSQGVRFRAIVYDILAWTQPTALGIVTVGPFNDYIEVLRAADARCHISHFVRDQFVDRILRRPSSMDTVITLGADAMGAGGRGGAIKPQLIVPGALDGRKGQDRVVEAYLALPAARRLPMIVAGRVPAHPRPEMQKILDATGSGLSVVADPDDATLGDLLATSRGCLFPSQFEGFGLPALESLHLGTPVVVDAALPAISGLPALGQIRLVEQDLESLKQAILAVSDADRAGQLRQEALTLALPTWDDYARDVSAWASA